MKMKLKSNHGFSFVELMLTLIVTGIITSVATGVLYSQTSAFEQISGKQSTSADLRLMISRLQNDLEYLETSDLLDISENSISYFDQDGEQIDYQLSGASIIRNGETVATNIQEFAFHYYNEASAQLPANDAIINQIRAIRVSSKTAENNPGGQQILSAYIIPRTFMGYTLL